MQCLDKPFLIFWRRPGCCMHRLSHKVEDVQVPGHGQFAPLESLWVTRERCCQCGHETKKVWHGYDTSTTIEEQQKEMADADAR